MQLATVHKLTPTPQAETSSRPGLTSLIRTGRGLMTVQTEIVGEPAQLVTIVDFRGRVLKRWQSDFCVASSDPEAPDLIRKWHAGIEARVRENLAKATRRRPQTRGAEEVVSHLYVAAMRAYAERDLDTARDVLRACALLLPDDKRISAGLERLRATAS